MIHRRRTAVWRSLVTAVTLFTAILVFSPVAVAGTANQGCEEGNGGNPHCYSEAEFYHELTAVYGTWNDENMSPGGPYDEPHIDSEFWLRLSDGAYIETGLYNGWENFLHGTNECHCGAYAQFWSDTSPGGYQWVHIVNNITPDGKNHSYEIARGSKTNEWYVYIDSNLVGNSLDTEQWVGDDLQVGGELQAPNEDEGSFANTYNMYVDGKYASGWFAFGKPNAYSIFPGFNAQTYGNSEYSWNEPQ